MVIGKKVQTIAVLLLVASFIVVAQPLVFSVYRWGFVLLIAATIFQIAAGNLKPHAEGRDVIRALGITVGALVLLSSLSIVLVPYLVRMGQGG